MTDRELMQQALEKLDFFAHMKSVSEDTMRLIADLRERLAQPEREWVGLTNADKHEAFEQIQEASEGFWEFADYLEAKLREKNI